MGKFITRESYLNRLIDLRETPDIKIITGIRRSGKSELLKAYIDYLKNNYDNANIIFIDFNDIVFSELKDHLSLNSYIEKSYDPKKINFVFIDEVQLCKDFEITVNSLHNSKKYDIYITGFNAFLLSSDLATLFTGRFIEIQVFPFSFREFSIYYDDIKDISKLFDMYVKQGGMAGAYNYKNEEDVASYIRDVYVTIVMRDLVSKYSIQNTAVLDNLSEFLMDNIANITSPNKISNTLSSNKIATNHVTIQNYIKYLCNAFLFYDIYRYDMKGKKYLETSKKYYLCDISFRHAINGNRNQDFGRIYENIVAIELLRRGYRVYVGKFGEKEIDFIALKGNDKIYIQVSDNNSGDNTFKREVSSLLQIRDAYPKMLISRTNHEDYTYEGVKIIDIKNWLLS